MLSCFIVQRTIVVLYIPFIYAIGIINQYIPLRFVFDSKVMQNGRLIVKFELGSCGILTCQILKLLASCGMSYLYICQS
jgi:uncharacterized membrane protein